jgi:hypothetical protein
MQGKVTAPPTITQATTIDFRRKLREDRRLASPSNCLPKGLIRTLPEWGTTS